MLVNLEKILQPALTSAHAVACFNVFGFEDASAVVAAAESRNASVILAVNLDMTEFMPMASISGMLRPLAEAARVPVCLHLDHHYDAESVMAAVDCGFSSVMYDCSQKPIAENIASITEVVRYAHAQGVSVEAEVGSVPYASGRDHIKSALTEVAEAVAMVTQAKPDALAISVGNVHRLVGEHVDINFEQFTALEQALDLPLVIHGTSGIKPEDIRRLAQGKVCKFNIGTRLRQRFGQSLRQVLRDDEALFDRLSMMKKVMPGLTEEAAEMIALLGQ